MNEISSSHRLIINFQNKFYHNNYLRKFLILMKFYRISYYYYFLIYTINAHEISTTTLSSSTQSLSSATVTQTFPATSENNFDTYINVESLPFNSLVHSPQLLASSSLSSSSRGSLKGWECHCLYSLFEFEDELECQCHGDSLLRIPQKLHKQIQRLIIESAGLQLLRRTALKVYANSLKEITLRNLANFESIQAGAFESIKHLRMILIDTAPKLTYLSKDVFANLSPSIKTIRIINSGLLKIPNFEFLNAMGTILQLVDLEGNNIDRIDSKSVIIKTEELILDHNVLRTIDNSAFYGSQIAKLSIKENRQLKNIHSSAFLDILNLRELDLSGTSLVVLPSIGLQDLEILRVQNTHTLKTIPSIYNFKNLQVAWLTHSFHCCAFKFPSRHDPSRHAERLQYLANLQKTCMNSADGKELTHDSIMKKDFEDKYDSDSDSHSEERRFHMKYEERNDNELLIRKRRRSKRYVMREFHSMQNDKHFNNHFEKGNSAQIENDTESNDEEIHPIRGSVITSESEEHVHSMSNENELNIDEDQGLFHNFTDDVARNNLYAAVCGNFTKKEIIVSCFPIPDDLNPCEDVMGSKWLRASVWIVLLLAVFGNFSVLTVILCTRTDGSVPKFLMAHLSFADLCMGLYLLLIASIDAYSMGEYFNYAFDWQYGAGCKIAGFLTVFASHLSVFTLTIITLERWFAITQALNLNRRIKLKPATYIMVGGWIYSFIMSTLPLLGISTYSSTSICLPMEARDSLDVVYLVSILGINGAAFFVIAICYVQIYFSLGRETRNARSTGEMTVAKKMALLVFTNFSCWAPIAFFGLTALAGYPLINVTKSKILLVFFYPLNSCADPYLYAILTTQYRRDCVALLAKFGICRQRRKAVTFKESPGIPITNLNYQPAVFNRLNVSDFNNSILSVKEQTEESEIMLKTEEYV